MCRQMGFESGEIYTFGSTTFLPTLPVVVGWRACDGSEADIFACRDLSGKQWSQDAFDSSGDGWISGGWEIADSDCSHGCLGEDGEQGVRAPSNSALFAISLTRMCRDQTADDTIDPTSCNHRIDQGAICHEASSPQNVLQAHCGGCHTSSGSGTGGCALSGNTDQPVVFSVSPATVCPPISQPRSSDADRCCQQCIDYCKNASRLPRCQSR